MSSSDNIKEFLICSMPFLYIAGPCMVILSFMARFYCYPLHALGET